MTAKAMRMPRLVSEEDAAASEVMSLLAEMVGKHGMSLGAVLAGALGALVYALHCPEMATPFLAVWYLAGIAIPTALGAMLGPRLLRW